MGRGVAGALARAGDGLRRALDDAAYAIGAMVLVGAAALGWLASPPLHPLPGAEEPVVAAAVAVEQPASSADLAERLQDASDVLLDPSVTENAKLALVEEIAGDPRESATGLLLSAARSESLLVSMASIRALRGRPCDQVAIPLASRLSHGDWQQRAWAAKVLGENGCATAAPELKSRLARERDTRVRRQLSTALGTLGAGAAG